MEEQVINKNRIRQVFFLGAIVFWGILLIMQLYSFLPALLGAITLYIVLKKPMTYLVSVKKWGKSTAASVLMFLTFIVILIPITVLVQMLSSKVAFAIEHSNELVAALKIVISDIEQKLGITVINTENFNKLGNFIAQAAPKILDATFSTLVTIFFMYFILYFLLVSGKDLENGIYEYVPLKDENVDKLGRETTNIVLSNAIGIPVIAFMQGVVAIIGYYILGVKEPWFWFVVTCITAMLPFIGAALAYVPLAIIFFANDQIWQGVVMLIFGFGVIGTVDNIFRLTLAKKIGNIHPLITVFGVIIGLKLFGFVGLIFGPLLISMFILMIQVYINEFNPKDQRLIV